MWKTDCRALRVRAGSATVPGHRRVVNQDAIVLAPGVFGVADGVGGTVGGEVASAITAEAVVAAVAGGSDGTEAARAAHDAVRSRRASESDLAQMASTLCVAIVGWDDHGAAVQVTNVGDSRGYLLTPAGRWQQLTRDQSYVQDLVDQGVISAEQATQHPRRNIITSSVGHDRFTPVSQTIEAAPNMRLVFCSDGVSDVLDGDGLADLAAEGQHPQLAANEAVRAVEAAAGRDDATIVVVDVIAVARGVSDGRH